MDIHTLTMKGNSIITILTWCFQYSVNERATPPRILFLSVDYQFQVFAPRGFANVEYKTASTLFNISIPPTAEYFLSFQHYQ